MTKLKMGFLLSCMASAALYCVASAAGTPYPRSGTPQAVDRGALVSTEAKTLTVTVLLGLPKVAEAEALLQSLSTKGDPQYHRFLTTEQFVSRFAPTKSDVDKVVASLAKYGLKAERATATSLRVTGSPVDMERAFAVTLHEYTVPAHDNAGGYTYHAPLTHPTVPVEIAAAVSGVVGLDTRPSLRPLHVVAPPKLRRAVVKSDTTGNAFGSLTVSDFAEQYDVKPLYGHGITGKGRTLGIMTFAALTPTDAFAYWKAVGLSVDPDRLRIVNIDGGPGAPSDDSGSVETTLDVEQSGGVAPAAHIVVYQGPNTNQGFVDVIAEAVDSNTAESLSISWGDWEWFYNLENSPVANPEGGRTVSSLQATHELLLRAALQGQTVFAAAADSGAYDVNGDLGCLGPYSSTQPLSCSLTLSADYPASDTAITAAGGTTLPGTQDFCLNAACTPPYYVIDLTHERVWGWDYLNALCAATGYPTPIDCGTFPTGGGGGVSVFSVLPLYQFGVPGIQVSQPHQVYQAGEDYATELGVGLYFALPSYFPGRNVPDISFDADPETGYIIYYTSEPSGEFDELTFYGGTSFVAPQLNGVAALLGESVDRRIGLLNFPLYQSAAISRVFKGSAATVHPIAYGDNWFYHGSDGYNPAAGLGTLDVANFAKYLSREF